MLRMREHEVSQKLLKFRNCALISTTNLTITSKYSQNWDLWQSPQLLLAVAILQGAFKGNVPLDHPLKWHFWPGRDSSSSQYISILPSKRIQWCSSFCYISYRQRFSSSTTYITGSCHGQEAICSSGKPSHSTDSHELLKLLKKFLSYL